MDGSIYAKKNLCSCTWIAMHANACTVSQSAISGQWGGAFGAGMEVETTFLLSTSRTPMLLIVLHMHCLGS